MLAKHVPHRPHLIEMAFDSLLHVGAQSFEVVRLGEDVGLQSVGDIAAFYVFLHQKQQFCSSAHNPFSFKLLIKKNAHLPFKVNMQRY